MIKGFHLNWISIGCLHKLIVSLMLTLAYKLPFRRTRNCFIENHTDEITADYLQSTFKSKYPMIRDITFSKYRVTTNQ